MINSFSADQDLGFYVRKKKREAVFGIVYAVFFCFFFAAAFYYKTSSTIEYTLVMIPIVFLAGVFVNSIINFDGHKLNKLVNEVVVLDDQVVFKTYPYRFLFYKIPQQNCPIIKNDLTMEAVDFPFNTSGLTKTKTLLMHFNDSKIYVVYECFPAGLTAALKANIVNGEKV